MASKINRFLLLMVLFIVSFFANQQNAFANHAGAIEISSKTYTIFLYVLIALGVSLFLVLTYIFYLTKQIKGKEQNGESYQGLLYRRKFLFIIAIMLIIGFLSEGLIYFFLQSAANGHH